MAPRRVPSNFVPTPSGVALANLLARNGPEAEAIRRRVHRTMLWRYTTGRGLPEAETIAMLDELSRGRVPARGWTHLAAAKRTGSES